MKLSPYTEAKNCTDIKDIKDGIEEIKQAITDYKGENKKIPAYFFIRLSKLKKKLLKLQKSNITFLSVTIDFNLDKETLSQAVDIFTV